MLRRIKNLFYKISSQFLINYILAFIISCICLFIIFLAVGKHINDKYDAGLYNDTAIRDYVENKSLKELYDDYQLSDGSYVEVITNNNEIIDEYKAPHDVGYIYTWDEIDKIYESENTLVTSLNNRSLIIIHVSDDSYLISEEYIVNIYYGMFVSIILSIIFIIVVFSRISAKRVVRPIGELVNGVEHITLGDYSSRMSFRSNNELGHLRDSINTMAETIENEISLREKTEKNRQRLILDISHDLKTPLTNILGYSETLLHDADISDDIRQSLNIIASNSKKANNLLTDLVDLSHLDTMDNSSLQKYDMCEFIRELIIEYIPEFDARSIIYNIEIPDRAIYVNMNRVKLNRAISNIINNFIKYVTKEPKIDIALSTVKSFVILTVTDNGEGIPTDFAEDIFEPFVRLDSSRNSKTGGTGLGLSISKAVIQLHRGFISIDKDYKDGTRFIIKLPYLK